MATMNLLRWGQHDDYWMRGQGFMEWLCYCGAEVSVSWSSSVPLYDTDEPIEAKDAVANSWELVCHNGHTLLVCHEVAEDEGADTFDAPTTASIVERLASAEDIAAWRVYEEPKPPWGHRR